MSSNFGISQLMEYLVQMNMKVARVDQEREVIELLFHSPSGQWRMIVGFQQGGEIRKLMFVVPHVARVTEQKRLECLEALMAVNFRIAMGKFGLDLRDGEVRLEETIPIAEDQITLAQFRLIFGALMQTMAIYHNLLTRIIQQNVDVQDAIRACEQDFFAAGKTQQYSIAELKSENDQEQKTETKAQQEQEEVPALDVEDIMAEVTWLLQRRHGEG